MKLFLKIVLACLPVLLFTACTKDRSVTPEFADGVTESSIQAYLFARNEVATRDPSGVYYKILTPGDSIHYAKPSSVVFVKYTYELLDGTVVAASFDATSFNDRELKNHIPGWQIGLQKISKGGKIRLYIPPGLAFGSIGIPNVIPPNVILISNVELVDIR